MILLIRSVHKEVIGFEGERIELGCGGSKGEDRVR
jgi:hypothetical protein